MSRFCKAIAAWVAVLPLIAGAQDAGTPAAEHPEHEQHAAPAGEVPAEQAPTHQHMQGMQQHMQRMGAMQAAGDGAASPGRCAEGDMPCSMNELRSQHGMMQQRVRLLEERLDAMQQQLQQALERLDAAPDAPTRP